MVIIFIGFLRPGFEAPGQVCNYYNVNSVCDFEKVTVCGCIRREQQKHLFPALGK